MDAENLPIVLKFLLKTASAAELPEVGDTLKKKEKRKKCVTKKERERETQEDICFLFPKFG